MELIPIEDKIYEIRGRRVMLDFDLAEMYEVENKNLKRQVKRNIERFPNDFMFELTKDEWEFLRCHFGTSNRGGIRYMPMAFTQEGVAMLSGVLRSPIAVTTNIKIMRAFVAVRQLLLNPPTDRVKRLEDRMEDMQKYLEDVFTDYNDINEDTRLQLELINEALAKLEVKHAHINRPRRPVGFIQHEV